MDDVENQKMQDAVSYFRENSKIKSNGIREIPKAAYLHALKGHDVTEEEIKRVNDAVDFQNTAAAHLALSDLEEKIQGTDKDQLADDTHRRGLFSTVRLLAPGGSTEVRVGAEASDNIPRRADADGNDTPQTKLTFGRTRLSINTKSRIHKDFHAEADSRMRKALGIA